MISSTVRWNFLTWRNSNWSEFMARVQSLSTSLARALHTVRNKGFHTLSSALLRGWVVGLGYSRVRRTDSAVATRGSATLPGAPGSRFCCQGGQKKTTKNKQTPRTAWRRRVKVCAACGMGGRTCGCVRRTSVAYVSKRKKPMSGSPCSSAVQLS